MSNEVRTSRASSGFVIAFFFFYRAPQASPDEPMVAVYLDKLLLWLRFFDDLDVVSLCYPYSACHRQFRTKSVECDVPTPTLIHILWSPRVKKGGLPRVG